ncbi:MULTISPECIES: SRPBCC domain-containing protein [unclassified Chelatococcus]|uniref:SRPBCC domain-containing protein n=1 Tax=unclassified Chelatococcus TaxID=2638111 RepID=UPI001BCBD5A9|nr:MULTISPECIES: SRPBCC domain-containing protein [unclassified Chelatococcus]MBS7700142.1 hypothetical protein [Chelatococcus sp. YT9]MBX3556835.1 hypothetical protein [Chelatococcus sp.]
MNMSGSYQPAASRQEVCAALNNPDVLRHCIPGRESLVMRSPEMGVVVTRQIGPLSFTARLRLTETGEA